ncbi:MAG: DNA-directed RNA polymerase subunit alpha C-terminal domain-containing protein, partial [Candidatus Omnitrophota bacterium]
MNNEPNILDDVEAQSKLQMPVSNLDFSVRTTNCLATAQIEFVHQLVRKNEDDLLALRNFGRKCLAEIKTKLKDRGLSLGMRIDIELKSEKKEIASGQEEQLKLISIQDLPFSERARHVLEKSGRRSLYDLLAISNEDLLAHRNCGRKTAAEILSLRDQYIKKQMNPESGLEVTFEDFLNMIKERFMNESALAEIVRDPKAIYIWQNRYCSAKKKTLEELGNHFGVTRERIRQLESKFIKMTLLKRIDSSYQKFMKHFLEDVRLNEGIKFYDGSQAGLETPEFEIFNNLLGFIDGNVAFDNKWNVWIRKNVKLFDMVERFIALECVHKTVFTQVELDSLFNDFFNGKVNGRGRKPKVIGPRNVPDKDLFKKSCVSVLFRPLKDGYLYTKAIKAEVLQDVIRIGFPNGLAIYRDLDKLVSCLADMGLDNFFGASGRAMSMFVARLSNVVLWDWGIYIHTSNIKVDVAILERVKNWLDNKFSAGVDRVSLWGAFTELEQDCKASGIPNEHALYSCMKMQYKSNYYFTHDPHVMKSRINVKSRMIDCVEEYIRDSEEAVPLDEIESHFGLKDFQVLQRIDDLDEVLPCEGRRYVHIDRLSIDESLLSVIKDSILKDISTSEHISIKNVYENNIVYCKQQNIM